MRGKFMKKLLAVLVMAGLFGSVPVILGEEVKCGRYTYYCEYDRHWGRVLLCPAGDVCGGKRAHTCNCSTEVFGKT